MTSLVRIIQDKAFDFKKFLKKDFFYDNTRLSKKNEEGLISIPVKDQFLEKFSRANKNDDNFYEWEGFRFEIGNPNLEKLPPNPKNFLKSPILLLKKNLNDDNLFENLKKDLPTSWEKHNDLILIPHQSLLHPFWQNEGNLKLFCKSFNCTKLARKNKIVNNNFRSPQVQLLVGEDPWVTHLENNIIYTYNIERSMFCPGNLSEKMRMGDLDLRGQVALDLYAGIGYFTLSLLLLSKADHVICCEWNPWAVEALKKNLKLNKIKEKNVTILEGDNKEVCPKNIADHVILGLIPSSEAGWKVACESLNKEKGGILHIHGTVQEEVKKKEDREQRKEKKFEKFNELDNIKINENNFMIESKKIKKSWVSWSCYVKKRIEEILREININNKEIEDKNKNNIEYLTIINHIEKVKNYAPHVEHLVVDIQIKPVKK